MVRALGLALAAALSLGACTAAAPADPPPLTWARLRIAPPETITRELFGAFGKSLFMLGNPGRAGDSRPGLPLRYLHFQTRPRASYRAGLCESDWIMAELEPVSLDLIVTDGVRPRRLTQLTNYIVQDLAKVRIGDASVDEMPELEQACAAIDPREAPRIVATTAFDITGTVPLVADLVEAALGGRSTAPLTCEGDNGVMREAECLRMLAALKPEAISTASLQAGCGRQAPDIHCRRAGAWHQDRELAIVFEMRRGDPRAPARISVTVLPDQDAIIN